MRSVKNWSEIATITQKTLEDTRKFVTMTAQFQGWELLRDEDLMNLLLDGLMTNYNRYGYFLCPCRDGHGTREDDHDIICPCAYCVPDQLEYGHCYCGLYLTPDFFATWQDPGHPQQRPQGSC